MNQTYENIVSLCAIHCKTSCPANRNAIIARIQPSFRSPRCEVARQKQANCLPQNPRLSSMTMMTMAKIFIFCNEKTAIICDHDTSTPNSIHSIVKTRPQDPPQWNRFLPWKGDCLALSSSGSLPRANDLTMSPMEFSLPGHNHGIWCVLNSGHI